MNTGIERIAAERKRQIEKEGWTPEHDDQHTIGEMAIAARCYLRAGPNAPCLHPPAEWPWSEDWWKPSEDPIRNLEKAGALIAAEIDRLSRIGDAAETYGYTWKYAGDHRR